MFDILCTVMLLWIGITSMLDVVRNGITRPKPIDAVASFESAARKMTERR